MRNITKNINRMFMVGVFALLSMGFAQLAAAVTSGGATIHNAVTVSYTSGATTLTETAVVNVTVTTTGAAPTVTASANATVTSGGSTTYIYTVRSNTNGPDTYTPGNVAHVDTTVSATTSGALGAAFDLWAGHVLSAGAGTISVPALAVTGLVAGVSTIELLVDNGGGAVQQRYTVTTIGASAIATTTTGTNAGVTTAETNAVLTLTPIGGADAIVAGAGVAGSVAVGTQVGEYTTFTNVLTAGTPTTPGTDGSISTTLDVVTTTGPFTTNVTAVTTTVSSPNVTITKQSRNVTAAGAFAASGTTAKPGEVIEYQITVTNGHASASATAVRISDVIPVYTTIVTGAYNGAASEVSITETINSVVQATTFGTAAIDTDVAEVQGGTTLVVNIGAGAGDAASAANGGTITGNAAVNSDFVVILYQVTVQ